MIWSRILLICVWICQISCFYVYLEGSEKKCFYKDLSQNNLLIGKYKLEVLIDSTYQVPRDVGIMIDVEETFDDNHRVVHQKGSPNGEFTFSALEHGEHRICLTPTGLGWLSKTKSKLNMDFQVAHSSLLDSKGSHRVKSLSDRINVLNDKLVDIRREQLFIREREATFRDQSESTNSRVVKWSIIQLIVLTGTCLWQLRSLRVFFVKQKVV